MAESIPKVKNPDFRSETFLRAPSTAPLAGTSAMQTQPRYRSRNLYVSKNGGVVAYPTTRQNGGIATDYGCVALSSFPSVPRCGTGIGTAAHFRLRRAGAPSSLRSQAERTRA